jgi:hypothetical protein
MADASDNGKLSASELGEAALETIVELTGAQPEGVTGLEWDGDGEYWQVTVDVLELERIPNTTDVLASYAVQLDQEGTLRGYKRLSRFQRGQLMEEG